MPNKQANLASRTFGAGAWTVGTRLIAKLIDLVLLLCLARFLGPAEFGLVAMAMAAVFIIEALFELPTAAALIRVDALTPAMMHTAFTLSLLRGVVIALLLLALAWPLSAFNDEPRLKALLAVLALAPALRGLVSPRMVEFVRDFNFRPDAITELSGKAIAFIVSVVIAVTTRSYWAIAAATVCGPLVATLLSYYLAPLRPRLTFTHWSLFSSMIGWNFLSQLSAALNGQIDRLILPRLSSATGFGQYAMSKQLAEIPIQAVIQPVVRPAMAAMAAASDSLSSRYLQLSHAIALVMVPVMGISLLWPDVLVRVALGPAWLPAAEWLRWMSAIVLIGLPSTLLSALAMTLDRTRWQALRPFVELLFRLPLVWLGAVHFGIPGGILGSAIATASGTLTSLFVVRHLIGTGLARQLMTLCTPMLAMVPAGAVLWLIRPEIIATGNLAEMALWAVPTGFLYVLIYLITVLLAWWVSGKPAGLEQHVVRNLSNKIMRAPLLRLHFTSRKQTNSTSLREPNVKQSQ